MADNTERLMSIVDYCRNWESESERATTMGQIRAMVHFKNADTLSKIYREKHTQDQNTNIEESEK